MRILCIPKNFKGIHKENLKNRKYSFFIPRAEDARHLYPWEAAGLGFSYSFFRLFIPQSVSAYLANLKIYKGSDEQKLKTTHYVISYDVRVWEANAYLSNICERKYRKYKRKA